MMSGGVVPAGSCRSCVCDTAVTCAIAWISLRPPAGTPSTTATPSSDCDSTCPMLSTVVVSARSVMVTIRFAHLLASRPE